MHLKQRVLHQQQLEPQQQLVMMLGRAHATVAATVTTHGTPAATSALLQLQQWMQLQQLQQREVQQQQQQQQQQVQAAFMAVGDALAIG
jgi:hypothetical protein